MRTSGRILVDFRSAVGADLGIFDRCLFLLCKLLMQRIHPLYEQEDDKSHDDEVDDGGEEGSVIEGGGTGFFCLCQRVIVAAIKRNKPVVEINSAGDLGDERHDDIIDQGGDDLLEGASDNDTDRHVDDISSHQKGLKLRNKSFFLLVGHNTPLLSK